MNHQTPAQLRAAELARALPGRWTPEPGAGARQAFLAGPEDQRVLLTLDEGPRRDRISLWDEQTTAAHGHEGADRGRHPRFCGCQAASRMWWSQAVCSS